MSIDKEALENAMEFLPDEPIVSLASDIRASPPPLNTAQDLLEWVLGDPQRNKNQKSNEAAAIKWLGKVDGIPLASIPLEVRYLVDDRVKRIRQHKPLKKVRRSNIVTLLNQVLCRAGILKVGSRRGGITSHDWTVLINSICDKDARVSLSTLGKFCSSRNIPPSGVTLAVWDEFAEETLYKSSFKKPRATLQKTLRACNRARATISNWPLPEFPKLINPRLVSVPKGDLPTTLWKDIDTYVNMSSTPPKNIFDITWPTQLSPDTLQRYRDVAWRTASAQVHQGRAPSEITSLDALLEVGWLQKAMSWFHQHAGDTFLKDHLNMAATWVSFADNYVHPPAERINQIRNGIFKVIEKKLGTPGFSKKNIEKLEQFSNPAIVEDFLFLPYRIMAEIKKKKVITINDATQMMAALAMELLLTTMVRRKNLADIDLKTSFWPAQPTAGGVWSLVVDPRDVKNKQPLRFELTKQTIGMIQFYLKRCRPLLLKASTGGQHHSDLLFLPVSGKFQNRRTMVANLVSNLIRKCLDLNINVHLFRHIGTMLYLDAHPGNFGVPQVMLGHTSDKTTQKFYAHLQATKAIKHFTAAVLGSRNDKITKLKLA
ncbi:tyrosine-type recombinase/integrase [Reyranella sp.]|uniref:tyrosine-type recombinase/integrase n=1 Tax=Reyranella sp. TaxID=1929291 RepID=UPI003D138F9B